MPDISPDYVTISTVTATGGYSSGMTIPIYIMDALGLERGTKIKVSLFGKKMVVEEAKL